jgi:hypothetical protein
MLIWFQNPQATYVAGFRKWMEMGRQISNWDRPIYIIAPRQGSAKYQENELGNFNENELRNLPDRQFLYFSPVKVYDYADTTPIENWKDPKTGTGPFEPKSWRKDPNDRVEEITALVDATLTWAKSQNIDIQKEEMAETLGGFSKGGEIKLNNAFEGINLFSTLVHECAHETLHWVKDEEGKTRLVDDGRREVEIDAETTAYIVLQHYGFETKDTPNYLALFKATGEDVKKRRDSIAKAVKTIISGIDKVMEAAEVVEPAANPAVEPIVNKVENPGEKVPVQAFNLKRYLEKRGLL